MGLKSTIMSLTTWVSGLRRRRRRDDVDLWKNGGEVDRAKFEGQDWRSLKLTGRHRSGRLERPVYDQVCIEG